MESQSFENLVYRDYSNDISPPPQPAPTLQAESSTQQNKVDHSFPVKLHYVLNEIEKDGLSHIVSWQPHGRCFKVHNRGEFVKTILLCWFRMSKFTSFQRQLNLYGFRRLTTGMDKGGYYHERFLRSKQFLADHIQRITIKGRGGRKPAAPHTEPNFYKMSFLPCGTNVGNICPLMPLKHMLPSILSDGYGVASSRERRCNRLQPSQETPENSTGYYVASSRGRRCNLLQRDLLLRNSLPQLTATNDSSAHDILSIFDDVVMTISSQPGINMNMVTSITPDRLCSDRTADDHRLFVKTNKKEL